MVSAIASKSMPREAGDDLSSARDFIEAAGSDVAVLLSNLDILWADACACLGRIQAGAHDMHARAIERAAVTALTLIETDRATLGGAGWAGQIFALNKLIVQYGSGLTEVKAALIAPDHMSLPADIADATPAESNNDIDMNAAHRTAQEILAPLISFAETANQRTSLRQLAGLAARDITQTSTQPSWVETLDPSVLESLFEQFTASALAHARQTDKIISVSYDLSPKAVSGLSQDSLQSMLERAVVPVIDGFIEPPERRKARGESGAGHIAIGLNDMNGEAVLTVTAPATPRGGEVVLRAFPDAIISANGAHCRVEIPISTRASMSAPKPAVEAKDTLMSDDLAVDMMEALA